MTKFKKLSIVAVALVTQACTGLNTRPEARDIKDMNPPGYFDIGVGYGYIVGAGDGEQNDDADGLLVSFKGYPFGRWYSTVRISQAKANLQIKAKQPELVQEFRRLPNLDGNIRLLRVVRKRVRDDDTLGLKKIKDIATDKVEIVGSEILTLPPGAGMGAIAEGTQMVGAVVDPVALPFDPSAVSPGDVAATLPVQGRVDIDKLVTELSGLTLPNNYVVRVRGEERGALHHLSVFYGLSVGNFGGGGIDSTVHALGLGFDVTPELALLGGAAFYRQVEGTEEDADIAAFFGISLNLNAFKSLYNASLD